MTGPLTGVRVLEVSQVVAGPYAGLNLADLGADVVKIEPPTGEAIRHIGAYAPGESKGFHYLNRGKRSLTLDLSRPEAQEVVHQIIPSFDVFLINSRAGVSKRLRIDYDTLRQFRPDLIYLDSTGFGNGGPNETRSGTDVVVQAYSGLMASEGKIDDHGAPQAIQCGAVADWLTALAVALGICAALYRRAITGQGDYLETSLLASAMAMQSGSVARLPVSDELLKRPALEAMDAARQRGGSYEEILAARKSGTGSNKGFSLYYRGYRVKDGAIILGGLTPANRDQMRRAMGITNDPSTRPDFNALNPEDEREIDELERYIRDLLLTKTMDEWLEIFDREGAPVSKVNFPEYLADDPQVEEMGYMIDLEHELSGPERMVGPIVRMREHRTGSDRPAPVLGRHNEEILAEAGLSAGAIAALRTAGAMG